MELLSNCCSAPIQGEPSNLSMIGDYKTIEGRCSRCKEMAELTEGE